VPIGMHEAAFPLTRITHGLGIRKPVGAKHLSRHATDFALLLGDPRHRTYVLRPRQLGLAPDPAFGRQVLSLREPAHAEGAGGRIVLIDAHVHRGAAVGAERVATLVAAVRGGLEIAPRRPGEET